MIMAELNGQVHNMPSGWWECTYQEFINIAAAGEGKRSYAAARIPYKKCSDIQKEFIKDAFAWAENIESAFIYAINYDNDLNIGLVQWGDFEKCKQLLSQDGYIHLKFSKLCEILLNEHNNDDDMAVVFGKGYFLVQKITEFITRYDALKNSEPSAEQLLANVDRLNVFGIMAIAVPLARKYGVTHDEILKWPVDEVYMTLLYDKVESEVRADMQKIIQNK